MTWRLWAAIMVGGLAWAGPARAAEPAGLQIQSDGAAVRVKDGDRTVLEYVRGEKLFKPYVKQLFSPAGVNFLRDNVPDHIHHHGLMFAAHVDGADFWGEAKGAGRQVRRSITDERGLGRIIMDGEEFSATSFTDHIDWIPADADRPLLKENRTIQAWQGRSLGASLLAWRSELAPGEGRASVQLMGPGHHYLGLGMRFLKSMDNAGPFFTPKGPVDGEVMRGDERLTPGPWCAYAAAADGKPVTVAMFDHPGNPRPALWFTMAKPFAYLSATMNYHREPLKVEAGKPVAITYGVAVWDGKVGAGEIEKLYKRWLELTAPAAKEPSSTSGKP